MDFCGGRGKRGAMIIKYKDPRHTNIVIIYNFREREDEGKRRRKNDQNCPLWTYIKRKATHLLLGAWSFLLNHIRFTPSEESQRLCKLIIRNRTVEKGHLPFLTSWSIV